MFTRGLNNEDSNTVGSTCVDQCAGGDRRNQEVKKVEGFVWRESVYKNDFNCACGNQLADKETGYPEGYTLFDPVQRVIFCNKCMQPVAFAGEMEVDDEEQGGLLGDVEEYLKAKGDKGENEEAGKPVSGV